MPYQPFHLPNLPHIPSLKEAKNERNLNFIDSKINDLIASIIEKVVDGLLKALPKIIEKIFGKNLFELFDFSDEYQGNYQNNYGNNYNSVYNPSTGVKKLLGHFGLIGYLPLIFLKIIDGISNFMNILKRNTFFKNFLLPAGIVLFIAGSVVFLIWWFQSDSTKNYGEQYQAFSNYYDQPQYHSKPNNYNGNSYSNGLYGQRRMYDHFTPIETDYPDNSYNSLPYKKFASKFFDNTRSIYNRRGPYRSY